MSNGTLTADSTSAEHSVARATSALPSAARRAHRVLNHLVLIGVPVQFYAAGLAVFGAASFALHAVIGQMMIVFALLSLLVSLGARRVGASAGGPLLLFGLVVAQPILAFAPRASAPWMSALHPVVGLVIAVVAWRIERSLRSSFRFRGQ